MQKEISASLSGGPIQKEERRVSLKNSKEMFLIQ
jgi:hypothetical protein